MSNFKSNRYLFLLIAAGYFVDVYDILLFSIVRLQSLKALGLKGEQLTNTGIQLLNTQAIGMLAGGILWGMLADRFGRKPILYYTIICYSLANILNASIYNVTQYFIIRFFSGIGLAGEFGIGITLMLEILNEKSRGYVAGVITSAGALGAIFASVLCHLFTWRAGFLTGGLLGLMLLFFRANALESPIFPIIRSENELVNIRFLFVKPSILVKFLKIVMIGLPVWFIIGIVLTFSPEIYQSLSGSHSAIHADQSVLCFYIGNIVGAPFFGTIGQKMRSRKAVIIICLVFLMVSLLGLVYGSKMPVYFLAVITFMGFFVGYWSVLITAVLESFGTNLRATAATCVSNTVRGSVLATTYLLNLAKPIYGLVSSIIMIGIPIFILSVLFACLMKESWNNNLNYIEHPKLD